MMKTIFDARDALVSIYKAISKLSDSAIRLLFFELNKILIELFIV